MSYSSHFFRGCLALGALIIALRSLPATAEKASKEMPQPALNNGTKAIRNYVQKRYGRLIELVKKDLKNHQKSQLRLKRYLNQLALRKNEKKRLKLYRKLFTLNQAYIQTHQQILKSFSLLDGAAVANEMKTLVKLETKIQEINGQGPTRSFLTFDELQAYLAAGKKLKKKPKNPEELPYDRRLWEGRQSVPKKHATHLKKNHATSVKNKDARL